MGYAEELGEKVKAILQQGFYPADVGVSTRNGIVLFLVSTKFEEMDDMDRQEAIWNLLEQQLSREERRAVSIVVALTPKEHEVHQAGSV